jgi:aprataxin
MTETTLSRNTTKKWGKWSHRLLETIENADSPTYKDGIFFKDDDIIVIFDKYPKSKYHFLCLPRKLRIDEPQSLSREHVEILTKMLDKGKYVEKEIKRKNPQDISLPFRFGFHAKPSMRQLHMHIISQDFCGRGLKTLKHWNSFNTSFFIDCEHLIEILQQYGRYEPSLTDLRALKAPPSCLVCGKQIAEFGLFLQHWRQCSQQPYSASNNTNVMAVTNHS